MGYRNLVSVEVTEIVPSSESVMANITLILMPATERLYSATLKQKIAHLMPKFLPTLLILGMWSPLWSLTIVTIG